MSKIVGKISAEMIIVLIVIIALITFLVYKNVTKPEPIVYYVAKASAQTENTLITTQFKLRKLLNEKKVEEQMQNKNTFDKENILDKYTEEYFDSKKLAVISCYEDDSQFFEYGIDDIIYNEDRTEVTIKYTDHKENYLGSLTTVWYNYLFIELDGTVTNVNFELSK